MLKKTSSKREKKVVIQDLSSSAKQSLGKEQLRKISGGTYVCPGNCDYLVVVTVVETTLQVVVKSSKARAATKILPR
jgi:Icc-related predicted phosphoesterase